MAEMTIRLIPDPVSGKKNIIISLTGDQDALPHEHEQMHRAIVNKVLGGNKITLEEIGQITVEREEDTRQGTPTTSGEQTQREAAKQSGS